MKKKKKTQTTEVKKNWLTKFTRRLGEATHPAVEDTYSFCECCPLELLQRTLSPRRVFVKQSMKFLEKEVCDARGNAFHLFHSIYHLTLCARFFFSNTNLASFLQNLF